MWLANAPSRILSPIANSARASLNSKFQKIKVEEKAQNGFSYKPILALAANAFTRSSATAKATMSDSAH
jgi:hypothetical protein